MANGNPLPWRHGVGEYDKSVVDANGVCVCNCTSSPEQADTIIHCVNSYSKLVIGILKVLRDIDDDGTGDGNYLALKELFDEVKLGE